MNHSVLESAGPLAQHIEQLFWVFVVIAAITDFLANRANARAPAEAMPSDYLVPRWFP